MFYATIPLLSLIQQQIKNLQASYPSWTIMYEHQSNHLPWNKGLWCKQVFFAVIHIARDWGEDGREDNKNSLQPCIFDVAAVLCCDITLPEETRCIKQCLTHIFFKHWKLLLQQVLALSSNICSSSCVVVLWDCGYFGTQKWKLWLACEEQGKKKNFSSLKIVLTFKKLKRLISSLFRLVQWSVL